jgi:hypothetical protein
MTPYQRCLLRTAADAAGLPDGPLGDISVDTGSREQEYVLARNLAVCLLVYAGVHEFGAAALIPNHTGFHKIKARPPHFLLQGMHDYASKMAEGVEINDLEVELLQIHTERWFDSIKPIKC